jgi:hypothetical protein
MGTNMASTNFFQVFSFVIVVDEWPYQQQDPYNTDPPGVPVQEIGKCQGIGLLAARERHNEIDFQDLERYQQ